MAEVGLREIREAAARIAPHIHRTPVMTSRAFNSAAGGIKTYFKCENLQRGGAFKLRGAVNFLLSLSSRDAEKGVVAFSSGNHAQAVAIAAGIRGTKATLVMPGDAPKSKVAATRDYGGSIVRYDRLKEDREAIGRRIAEETGATLTPPFEHPWIIAGQGTAALELLEDAPELDALCVCVGEAGCFRARRWRPRLCGRISGFSESSRSGPTIGGSRWRRGIRWRFRLPTPSPTGCVRQSPGS